MENAAISAVKKESMSRLYPYSSALRSIGQALEKSSIEDFDLTCDDGEFHLQCGDPNPPYLTLIDLSYSLKDIESLERDGRARRRGQSFVTGGESLPEVLRVLGWLVDARGGRVRRICNSDATIAEGSWRLEYKTAEGNVKTEVFDIKLFHETAVSMRKDRSKMASRR